MRIQQLIVFLGISVISSLLPCPVYAASYYVSPSGNDSNPGTQTQPFKTLPHARDTVRFLISSGLNQNVDVILRGGTYQLTNVFELTVQDSGTNQYSVTYKAYPGEKPVISGGRRITGWTNSGGNIWTVQIPDVTSGTWYFRQLFVNGKRATRARTPNLNDQVPYWKLNAVNHPDDNSVFALTYDAGKPRNWQNITDVEIINLRTWGTLRKRLQSVNEVTGTVTLQPPHVTGQDFWTNNEIPGNYSYFENAIEMLDSPGEWYLNRKTGVLSYWPLGGENMATAEVIAPVLNTYIMTITGTSDKPITNLHFQGLSFQHIDWPLPVIGFDDFQATALNDIWFGNRYHNSFLMVPAVQTKFLINSTFDTITITGVGGGGLGLLDGSNGNIIKNSQFSDIGGNCIMVGFDAPPSNDRPTLTPKNNTIDNNEIRFCGRDYQGGVGIWLGYTNGTRVTHNDVHDVYYSGISCGWLWGSGQTSADNNRIEANHIHTYNQLMHDGAGIYVLSNQPGSKVVNNLIHGSGNTPWSQQVAVTGLYSDYGSAGYFYEGNIVYDTPRYGTNAWSPPDIRTNGTVDVGDWIQWSATAHQNLPSGINYFNVWPNDPAYPKAIADTAGRYSVSSPTLSPSPGSRVGDANGDGKIDGVDYTIWLTNYLVTTTQGPAVGDFNRDGKVDGVDYTLWLNSYLT